MRALGLGLVGAVVVLSPATAIPASPAAGTTFAFCGQTLKRDQSFVRCNDAKVTSIAPLVVLTDLHTLDLAGSGVSDLGPLRKPHGRIGLRSVDLSGTAVTNLEPLASHPHIEELKLDKTKVADLTPLSNHQSLSELSLNDTEVASIEPVLGLPKLSKIRLQRTPALTAATILRLARSKTLRMTDEQVRLLALYRLVEKSPARLQVTRHPNGAIKEVGILRDGKKEGWWALFDERADLIEEHDYWRGEPSRETYNWSYNRYNCVESSPNETYFLRNCLLDDLTLTRDERLNVLAHAERLMKEKRDDVVAELRSAAIVDDVKVREGIGTLLVKAGALSPASRQAIPSRERMLRYLDDLTRPLGKDFQGLQPNNCELVRRASPRCRGASCVEVSCSRFIGCERACMERHARLTIAVTSSGARLVFHDIDIEDRGLCGCCL